MCVFHFVILKSTLMYYFISGLWKRKCWFVRRSRILKFKEKERSQLNLKVLVNWVKFILLTTFHFPAPLRIGLDVQHLEGPWNERKSSEKCKWCLVTERIIHNLGLCVTRSEFNLFRPFYQPNLWHFQLLTEKFIYRICLFLFRIYR